MRFARLYWLAAAVLALAGGGIATHSVFLSGWRVAHGHSNHRLLRPVAFGLPASPDIRTDAGRGVLYFGAGEFAGAVLKYDPRSDQFQATEELPKGPAELIEGLPQKWTILQAGKWSSAAGPSSALYEQSVIALKAPWIDLLGWPDSRPRLTKRLFHFGRLSLTFTSGKPGSPRVRLERLLFGMSFLPEPQSIIYWLPSGDTAVLRSPSALDSNIHIISRLLAPAIVL